ncbi:MAG: alpha-L-fucosidase, partial [Lachnospiraceae bacterium]|nr:alpha-L-fucosidase [Lachnospiraceae bacterium]
MFEATFESLRNYKCPEWFRDVKFGIWSHWGPQSVPECGDWYARNMYIQGTDQYEYHLRTYGHPSKFGYKDICALWKAEKFDPDALMEKYYNAGARYFVAQASHHDHFFNFDSDYNRFNSTKVGPHKDICGLWKAAAKKYNMPFGMTEHLGASFAWWRSNKGCDTYGPYKGVPYDGNDPEYRDFYHDNYEHVAKPGEEDKWVWLTKNEKFHEYWLNVMKEIIDKYQPDLLYSDSFLPFEEENYLVDDSTNLYLYGLNAVSYLF